MIDLLQESLFQTLFNHLTEPRIVVRADSPRFTVVACNEQYKITSKTVGRDITNISIREIYGSDAENSDADMVIQNALDQAIATKEIVKLAAVKYNMVSLDGVTIEQAWWQTEYIPIKGANAEVAYLMCTIYNITDQITNTEAVEKDRQQEKLLQREKDLNDELTASIIELKQSQDNLSLLNAELEQRVTKRTKALFESETKFRNMIAQAPVAIGVLAGKNLVVESANDKLLDLWGKTKSILGKPLQLAMPELQGQPYLKILDKVLTGGYPFYGNEAKVFISRNNLLRKAYFNFVYHPLKGPADTEASAIMVVASEVTEQIDARRLVEESEKRFKFLLNTLPQQVWTALPEGNLDYVNQVVTDDFGETANEIVGLGWQRFIHPEDLPNALKAWKTALETGTEYMVEFRLQFKNGKYRWHLARAIPLIEDGKIKLWLGTNTNIDFQKNNEQQKDEFISIASHELKTPLTSIKAFNQMMKRTKDQEKLSSFIQKSAEHIIRLERLISDLLDVTKINAGKIMYQMQEFDFRQMLQESIESVQHTSPTHQIISETVEDVNYCGDRFRLEQVVNNFLTNAVKYSPEANKVIVGCKVELGNIVVSVQDFGIGIAKANLNRLFERYYREDNTAMRFEGLGLGLFISSEILKRHNGSFWIESEQGKGSTFYFRLPLIAHEERKTVLKTDTFYQDSSITICYNKEYNRLDVDWTGFQNMESVKNGGARMLEILSKNKCCKVINDNTHVLGTWSEAADWAGKEWFPMMEKAGLRYFAWIYSPSAFSQLSAEKSVDAADGKAVTHFFTDISSAEEWINKK